MPFSASPQHHSNWRLVHREGHWLWKYHNYFHSSAGGNRFCQIFRIFIQSFDLSNTLKDAEEFHLVKSCLRLNDLNAKRYNLWGYNKPYPQIFKIQPKFFSTTFRILKVGLCRNAHILFKTLVFILEINALY